MSADETMALTSVFMDRIAELERAAETTRAEHAAAIKRAEELEARLVDRETKCTEWASTAGEHAAKLAAAEDEAYQLGIAIEDHRAEHAAAANEAAIDALASQDELAEEMEAHKLTREAVKAAVDEWNGVSGALGLATARIRELEGEREELLVFARDIATDAPDDPEDCALLIEVGTGEERCIVERGLRARAIVARIEKVTKGTT